MAHGAGGIASRRLVEGLFAPLLFRSANPSLNDAAALEIGGVRMAMTTDSFVVKPLRFPGGSIGELAINGTVNDLAVSGAKPEAIVVSFILEAGLPTETLEAEVRAMSNARCKRALRLSAAIPRLWSTAKPIPCTSRPRVSVRTCWEFASTPARCARATKCCFPGQSVTMASPFCWREASWTSKPIFAPILVRYFPWWRRWRAKPLPAFGGCAIPRAEASRHR